MTKIDWVKNPDNQTQGITVNSKTGCLNHDNGLCKGGGFPCYAYKLAHGRLKKKYLFSNAGQIENGHQVANPKSVILPDARECALYDPFYPRFWSDRLVGIRKIQKPTGIFLDDMSDWMGEHWPKEWTEMELQVMRDCPQHRFYTLTKQPQNLVKFSPFPDNCWVGVTATNREAFTLAIYYLGQIQTKVKFISLEPLLENVIRGWFDPKSSDDVSDARVMMNNGIGWLIIGACTGTQAEMMALALRESPKALNRVIPFNNRLYTFQPSIEWVREIIEAADKGGIPVFLKDNLKPLIPVGDSLLGDEDSEYKWQLRQEVPKYGTD